MPLTVAIIGLGNRGCTYADIIKQDLLDKVELTAVCDYRSAALDLAKNKYGVTELFEDAAAFFEVKRADALIIASMDADHYAQAMRALDLGYDILLEKPIATTLEECLAVERKARTLGKKVAVCHVLRYTAFYQGIKDIIDNGIIGNIANISQTENVGYWHQAHAFVRGNWRSSIETAPMILSKCSHDLDILNWLVGDDCLSVSSYGSLGFFKESNAPANSAKHCFECAVRAECPYNAIEFYKTNPDFFVVVRSKSPPVVDKSLDEEVEILLSDKTNLYSRCVFRCDNDVVDRQAVNLRYGGDVVAQLTMTAFSAVFNRQIKIHGTHGQIEGDFNSKKYTVTVFGKQTKEYDLTEAGGDFSGHGGGDRLMLIDFLLSLAGAQAGKGLTSISQSVLSHRMAFAAEKSRLLKGKPIKL